MTTHHVPLQPERAAAAIDAAPRRSPLLHWAAFAGAAVSLLLLAGWMADPRAAPDTMWIIIDVALSVVAIVEFTTRSGFRWDQRGYAIAHSFDFFAMAPALLLVHQGLPIEGAWVWLLLAARATRALDRLLGDGFVRRNAFALLGAFEEALTDRIMLRIIDRTEADLARGQFGKAVGTALAKNKEPVLARVRAATPMDGLPGSLAQLTGLDKALEQAESRAFDAVVEIVSSEEVEKALRDVLASSFASLRAEVATKAWRNDLGFGPAGRPKLLRR